MNETLEIYWLHLAGANPPESFWEELGAIPHVEIIRETENEQAAEALLARLLQTPVPENVRRLAFLHIRDLEELYDGDAGSVERDKAALLSVLFSKGDPRYQSDPPVLHYALDILPYLEKELISQVRAVAAPDLLGTVETWRRSRTEHAVTVTETDGIATFTEAEFRMITSQIHSASGRVAAVVRRMRRAESAGADEPGALTDQDARSLIVRNLEETYEILNALERLLHKKRP